MQKAYTRNAAVVALGAALDSSALLFVRSRAT